MLVGERTSAPKGHDEAEDHNTGVSQRRRLHAYLADQPRAAKKFFQSLVRDPRVVGLLDESTSTERRWQQEHHKGDRTAFDRMTLMRSRQFAAVETQKLRDLLPLPRDRPERPVAVN